MIPNAPPLANGFSRKTLDANYAVLVRAGHPMREAHAVAVRHARRAFFSRHPGGALPLYLAHAGKRLAQHFYPDGREKIILPVRNYASVLETDAELYAERPSRRDRFEARLIAGSRYRPTGATTRSGG